MKYLKQHILKINTHPILNMRNLKIRKKITKDIFQSTPLQTFNKGFFTKKKFYKQINL